jgi:hypothetical protein
VIACACIFVLGVTAASLASKPPGTPGNGGKPKGGTNTCQPGYHEVRDQDGKVVGCEHNGDAGGNCGQNQSGDIGNGNGNQGNGGDKGYGNKDGCTETTTTETTGCTINCGNPCTANCGGSTPGCVENCGNTTTTAPPSTTPATTTTASPPASKPPTNKQLQKALQKQVAKLTAAERAHVGHAARKGELSNTGLPLLPSSLLSFGLIGLGLAVRRLS